MQRSWILPATVLLAASVIASGCGQAKQVKQASATGVSSPSPAVAATTPAPQPDKQLTIHAFFADSNAMNLIQKDVAIHYKADADKYLAALNVLKTSPDKSSIALSAGITYRSVTVKDGKATVDLSIGKDGQLGSGGEDMLLQSIQNTLFQFPELNAIDILLDGKAVESLMGHMDLPHPITRQ